MAEKNTKRGPGRPRLSEDVARLELKLPAALLEQVEERAARDEVSVSEWVRAALLKALAVERRLEDSARRTVDAPDELTDDVRAELKERAKLLKAKYSR